MHLFDHFDSWIGCMTNHNQFSTSSIFFRDSFSLSNTCCSTRWKICSTNIRSFLFFYIRGNVGLSIIFFRQILKEICSGGIKILKQEEGQKRFPTHLTNICFVPDPLVNIVWMKILIICRPAAG